MVEPLVSIVITNYQYLRFLPAAIDSASSQTYAHVETVVVDDGSTDGSRDFLASLRDRVRVVLQENAGQAAAFNAGFAASRGDIVLFLDADDVLEPDAVQRVVDVWSPDLAKVQFRLMCCDEELNPLGWTEPRASSAMPSGRLAEKVVRSAGYVSPPTSGNAFSRHCLRRILPMPAQEYRLCADAYLILLAPLYGEVRSIDAVLGHYRQHGSNQWNPKSMDAVRLRKMLGYDDLRGGLLAAHAEALGHDVRRESMEHNPAHLATRLASLRLDPSHHPVEADTRLRLLLRGLAATWAVPLRRLRSNLGMTVWFVAVALAPRKVAEHFVTWLFVPARRPGWLTGLGRMANRLVGPRSAIRRATGPRS